MSAPASAANDPLQTSLPTGHAVPVARDSSLRRKLFT